MKKDPRASRSVMGRRLIQHSPPKHPEASDPLVAIPQGLSRWDLEGLNRAAQASPERDKRLDRQPVMDRTEGGPSTDGGSESYNAQHKRRSRVSGFGKRGFKANEYGG
jgi:hypothetical protein